MKSMKFVIIQCVKAFAEMTKENIVRAVAGSVILISVALTVLVSPYWLILTSFVGLNLLQSSLTKFCPLECMLKDKRRPEQGDRNKEREKGT